MSNPMTFATALICCMLWTYDAAFTPSLGKSKTVRTVARALNAASAATCAAVFCAGPSVVTPPIHAPEGGGVGGPGVGVGGGFGFGRCLLRDNSLRSMITFYLSADCGVRVTARHMTRRRFGLRVLGMIER